MTYNNLEIINAIDSALDDMYFFLKAKNDSYGASAFTAPALCPSLPPRVAILTRMSDKLNRLFTGGKIQGESFDDTIKDLVGYGIIYLAEQKLREAKQAETNQEEGKE